MKITIARLDLKNDWGYVYYTGMKTNYFVKDIKKRDYIMLLIEYLNK